MGARGQGLWKDSMVTTLRTVPPALCCPSSVPRTQPTTASPQGSGYSSGAAALPPAHCRAPAPTSARLLYHILPGVSEQPPHWKVCKVGSQQPTCSARARGTLRIAPCQTVPETKLGRDPGPKASLPVCPCVSNKDGTDRPHGPPGTRP